MDSAIVNVDKASCAAAAACAIVMDAPIMMNSRDNKPPGIDADHDLLVEGLGNYTIM